MIIKIEDEMRMKTAIVKDILIRSDKFVLACLCVDVVLVLEFSFVFTSVCVCHIIQCVYTLLNHLNHPLSCHHQPLCENIHSREMLPPCRPPPFCFPPPPSPLTPFLCISLLHIHFFLVHIKRPNFKMWWINYICILIKIIYEFVHLIEYSSKSWKSKICTYLQHS